MMEQLKIDLTNLSRKKLIDIAERKNIELKETLFKEEIIELLYKTLTKEELLEISEDYLYAGRTSVSFWKYVPDEKTKNKIDKSTLPKILTTLCNGENPFMVDRRPEITKIPQIISARLLDDSIYRVLFVSLGKPRKIFENYDFRIIYSTRFTNAFLHIDSNIFEVRSEYHLAKKTADTFFKELNDQEGYEQTFRQIEIDLGAVVKLKDELGGKMKDHTGKTESGKSIYDIVKRTKAPDVDDLWTKPQFQEDIGELDTTASGIEFKSPATNEEITIEISTKQSSIFFRSYASEEDIRYFYDRFIGILGR
jgi:hypothetical protein